METVIKYKIQIYRKDFFKKMEKDVTFFYRGVLLNKVYLKLAGTMTKLV
jgi:hypothetical protein